VKYVALSLPELETLHGDVPLGDVVIREAINEPDELTGTLKRAMAYRQVRIEGTNRVAPLIRRRGTLIIADDGERQQAFIVEAEDEVEQSQDVLAITGVGFGWVLKETPWDAPKYDGVKVDPMVIVRKLFDYVTGQPGTINISVDQTVTPKSEWVGSEETTTEFTTGDGEDVSFDSGPYRLNWWSTADLYKELEDLAAETPFEWAEQTTMNRDTDDPPQFRIRLGYPRIEAVPREDHHFEIGFNVTEPQQPEDEDFFTHVLVLGNGDGSKKRRGEAARKETYRHRTVKVVTDQGLTSNKRCKALAQELVNKADREQRFIATCRVMDSPAARVGTFDKGDIIWVKGRTAWDNNHSQKCRIVAMERRLSDNSVALTLERWG